MRTNWIHESETAFGEGQNNQCDFFSLVKSFSYKTHKVFVFEELEKVNGEFEEF